MKPFDFDELLARLNALQRRPALTVDPVLACGDLTFNPSTRDHRRRKAAPVDMNRVRASGAASPPNAAVVTRRTIATQVWDDEADAVGSNTIDVHIGRLRAKLTGSRGPD